MADPKRRRILKYAGVASLAALTGTLLKQSVAYAANWNKALFENQNLIAVLSGVSNGVDKITPSSDIIMRAPEIAEHWAFVPMEVTSNILGTTRITLICKDLDFPLIAEFNLFDSAQSFISTRLRLVEVPNRPCSKKVTVLAIVHANGQVYSASKDVLFTHADSGEGGELCKPKVGVKQHQNQSLYAP